MVPLLRAEGGEKESQVGLVAPEDGRPTEAEVMSPDPPVDCADRERESFITKFF